MNKLFYNTVGPYLFPNFLMLILYESVTIIVELFVIILFFDKDKDTYGRLYLGVIIANMLSAIIGLGILYIGLGF